MAPLASLRLAALAVISLVAVPAMARPPAYTMSGVGFTTHLRGIPESERKEDCIDEACREKAGVVVAEGEAMLSPSRVHIVIREHKLGRELKQKELARFATRLASTRPHAKEVRLTPGDIAGHNAVEQWSTIEGCTRTVTGRVLLSLRGKVVEIETTSALPPGEKAAELTLARMHKVLSGVRVRRLGDESLDPADAPPSVKDMVVTAPKQGCK